MEIRLITHRRPDVFWVPTPEPVIEGMLRLAKTTVKDVVYDLGCGDGRIVNLAALKFGARGVGIDMDHRRVLRADENARKLGLQSLVTFICDDFFQSEIREASVVTLYLLSSLNNRLKPRFLEELNPGTRIVSHSFQMSDWPAEQSVEILNHRIYLWTVPARLAGVWRLEIEGEGASCREVCLNQAISQLNGFSYSNKKLECPVRGLVRGKEVSLFFENSVSSGASLRFSGTFKDDTSSITGLFRTLDGEQRCSWLKKFKRSDDFVVNLAQITKP